MSDEINIHQVSDEEIKAPVINFCTMPVGQLRISIPIDIVKEITDSAGIVPLPGSPDQLRGLINLRGTVLPVVDMAQAFGTQYSVAIAGLKLIIIETRGELLALLSDGMPDLSEIQTGDSFNIGDFFEKFRVK